MTRTHSFQISLPFVSDLSFFGHKQTKSKISLQLILSTYLAPSNSRKDTSKRVGYLNWWILQKHENNSFHPFSLQFYFATPFSYGSILQLWNRVILVHSYVTISWVSSSSHVRGSLAFQKRLVGVHGNNLKVYLHILGHNKFAFPLGSNKNILMLELPLTMWWEIGGL